MESDGAEDNLDRYGKVLVGKLRLIDGPMKLFCCRMKSTRSFSGLFLRVEKLKLCFCWITKHNQSLLYNDCSIPLFIQPRRMQRSSSSG